MKTTKEDSIFQLKCLVKTQLIRTKQEHFEPEVAFKTLSHSPRGSLRPARTESLFTPRGGGGGGAPYIRMKGMIVVFLGAAIGDLVFSGGCSSEFY